MSPSAKANLELRRRNADQLIFLRMLQSHVVSRDVPRLIGTANDLSKDGAVALGEEIQELDDVRLRHRTKRANRKKGL